MLFILRSYCTILEDYKVKAFDTDHAKLNQGKEIHQING
jgi:hypothetical protein